MSKYVVILDVPDEKLQGDDSIENACRLANEAFLEHEWRPTMHVRPLSEEIAC